METPKTLYKYVTADRALTCIPEVGDGTLRATQPAALNDPFEGAVAASFLEPQDLDFPHEAQLVWELVKVLSEINDEKSVSVDDVLQAKHEHGSLFARQLIAEHLSTRFGIVSFASDPLHPLMWSHYAGYGTGFVIGYDTSKIGILPSLDESIRKVDYREIPPYIWSLVASASNKSDLLFLLSLKSHYWSYENEWRLIVELDQTIGTGKTDPLGQPINLLRIPNEAVVSVHYTERTPSESVNLIRERLSDPNNRYRAGKPIKLVMSSTSYGYEEAPD